MQRILFAIVAAATGWGCGLARPSEAPMPAPLVLSDSDSPFTLVSAGEVHGAVPDDWVVRPVQETAGLRIGFQASPEPEPWPEDVGAAVGMSATWVDASRVGVPSDYYYLAANGPLLSRLTTSRHCHDRSDEVYLDRRPTFDLSRRSPGHFMASGEGICREGAARTHYAYFVAAPGFGPVHRLGIPSSGLYVVVAVVPQERGAGDLVRRLIDRTSFGDTPVRDFVAIGRERLA